MSRVFTCLFLLSCLWLSAVAQVTSGTQTLVSGQNVEREIAGGESHTYQITLTAGQWMRVVVEQKGIDLAVALLLPDGRQLIETNVSRGTFGQEPLSYEALAAGDYQVVVRPIVPTSLKGGYQAGLKLKEAATAQDKQRIAAERLLAEAAKLSLQGGVTVVQTIEKAQEVLPFWHELADQYWEAHTLNLIGNAYYLGRKYDQAIEYYTQALALRREVKNRWGEGSTLSNLGNVFANLSRPEKAIEYYEQSLAIYREVKDRSGEGTTLNNLGRLNRLVSHDEKALEYYEQLCALYREIKNRANEGATLGNLGNIYSSWGRYEKAIEYYEQTLAIAREVKNRVGEGGALNNLGLSYSSLGRYEKATEYYEQSLAIHRATKNLAGEGIALGNLGIAYRRLGSYEKAIEYYERSLAIHREVKHRSNEGATLISLGNAYSSLGRNEKAIEYLQQALAIHREIKNRGGEGATLGNLGNAYLGLSSYEKAIEYHKQALAIDRELSNRAGEAITLHDFAKVEYSRGNLAQARALIKESLQIVEAIRGDLISPESRTAFLASVQDSFQFYTDLLMRQHQAEPTKGLDALAIEVSERQRSRSLLDLLAEAQADVRQGVDNTLLERERILGRQLNDRAQRMMQANRPEQSTALKLEISQLETEYERVQAAIRKASPHYAALMQPQPLKLTEIQQQLDADTLLLEYALGPERSYLWAITKDSLTSYELPKEAEIKQSALQVYELLTARSANKRNETPPDRRARLAQVEAELPAAAQTLSQQVLGPVAAQLGNNRLVIVADGALQYIPFAMLPEPVVGGQLSVVGKNQPPATSHQPLIVRHELVSLPSASALAIQRTELTGRPPAPKMLAVIADPVFDRTDERLKTGATASSGQAETPSFDDARSIEHLAGKDDDKASGTVRKMVIPRLPYTRQEATQLLALTPKNVSFSAMDFQANRTTVFDPALSQYRYVHFATHGLADTERPGLSSLVLSTVDAQGKAQDGFLRANDIYKLKLPAELVVLSACQTGLGKDVKGEGLVGLTRGFMYAGAARVVVSLWSVNDRATSDLMTKFYQKMLKQGERPAAALRAAQVEMWKQPQWRSPYYWAAFVMQGEWK